MTGGATAPLLVELLTEELPPKSLRALGEAFAAGVREGLVLHDLADPDPTGLRYYASPRRLAVLVDRVLAQAPERPFTQRLVPASVGLDAQGRPAPALLKKLDALGLPGDAESIAHSVARESDGRQEILVYRGVRPGLVLAAGLQAALQLAIEQLPVAKLMSYQLADGTTTVKFARPAHGLVALHGTEVVAVQALGLQAGRATAGHRFHAPGPLRLEAATSYETQLFEQGKVIASFEARRAAIVEQLKAAAKRRGARVLMPGDLVDEVAALVEWPVVYESGFDETFLEVPQNCLVLTMQRHQKYFVLQDESGRLRSRFLLVSNIDASDPSAIVAGNARVVAARLADARFFFEQDRQKPLEAHLIGAEKVVYHARLGTQLQRIERLMTIAKGVAALLAPAAALEPAQVARAALLAKADLGTLMVGEFPELQGEMGAIYARAQGESGAVAQAIEEHYRPRFAGDELPGSMLGASIALADKLEALAGLFGAGERASGDKDPYALRRAALGVLRILQEKALPLDLQALLALSYGAFEADRLPAPFDRDALALEDFLYDRLRGMLQEQGYATREVDAVLAQRPGRIDRVGARMAAVRAFMQLPEAANLAAANKRIGNLLKKAPARGASGMVEPRLLMEPAERALADAYEKVLPRVDAALAQGDDTAVLRALAPLREPVDRFFDDVLVLVDEPALRANRLALLGRLRALMNRIADISLLAAG